jgi:chromosome segregation ATPase
LVASNNEHVKNTFKLNEDLAAKAIVMDEMNGKIRFKIAVLEDKSVEITHLNEQLKLSEAECVDQRAKMEDLVAMNEKSYGLTFSLENELEVKEMEIADLTEQLQQSQVESDSCHAEMKAFVATSKTNAGLISSLQDELKSKKMNLEDVTNRLLQSQVNVDKLTVKMEGLVAINEKNVGLISLMEDDLKAKKLTILDLTKKLQSVEITNIKERLNSTGCPAIPFSQVSSLENELEAEAMKNEEMTSGIRQTNASLEEKSAEILLLTERLNLAMNENNELKTKVEALVASSKEYVQNISTLKEELETKKIDAMHEESAAIAILMEQFQKSNASVEGLKGEMHRLVASNKEYVNKMSLLGDEVMAKQVTIDALNVEIQNLHSTCELTSLSNESKTSNNAMQLDLSKMSTKSEKATTELQGPLLSMPDLLIDEKSNSDKQLQEMVMNKGVEDIVQLYEKSLGEANPEILEKKKKYKILSRSLTKPWRKNVNKN